MYRKTYIEIDLDRLENNVKNIVKTFTGYKYYIGVIKGNAYGHGEYISKYITENGINYLAVSSLEEAISTRKYVNNDIGILCLEPISLDYIDEIIKYNISICVSNFEYFNKLKEIKTENKIKFHLKLNTGMNRLGISSKKEVIKIYNGSQNNDNIELEGIFTHLATSGLYDDQYKKQIDNFKQLVSDIDLTKIKMVHIGRSSTLEFFPKLDFCNGVRVGILMYGIESTYPNNKGLKNKLRMLKINHFRKTNNLPIPYSESKLKVKQSLTLKSEVMEIQKVKAKDHVGYGTRGIINSNGFVAIMPVGYADGLQIKYNNWNVLINGKKYPIVGSINMGMITALVDDTVKIGDMATIIDSNISYKKYAMDQQTTPYVLMTNLNKTIPRRYLKNGQIIKTIGDDN